MVFQWTHSIIADEHFLTPWHAVDQALQLQYEVAPAGFCTHAAPSNVWQPWIGPKCHKRVRFHQHAELYVGSEFLMTRWSHSIEVPVAQSKIFRPLWHPLYDESSFMATSTGHANRLFGPHVSAADNLMDNDAAVQNFDFDEDSDSDDYSEDGDGAEPPAGGPPQQPTADWCATILYALDSHPAPLRVDWNDYEATHNAAVRKLGIVRDHLLYLHHVRHPPQDLSDAGVEALVCHRFEDLRQGSTFQLVLLDVEFHLASPEYQPEVVRRVVRLPRLAGRRNILNRLGLDDYCRSSAQECILWHNHDLISHVSAVPLALLHGDYIRIAIPPGPDEVQHIATRCIASACHQGLTHAELCDRHTMFSLGWYDTIIGPPLVPLQPEEDHQAMLQLHMDMPALDQTPWFLATKQCKVDAYEPQDHFTDDPSAITRQMIQQSTELPGGLELRPDLDDQPEHIHNLLEQLEDHGLFEVAEEGPILYVVTWFLNHPHYDICTSPRVLRLTGEFVLWHHQFLMTWSDRLEEGRPVDFYLVFPQPPTTRMQPETMPHLIILQASRPEHAASIISIIDPQEQPGRFEHLAIFLPSRTSKDDIIVAADKIDRCYPAISTLQCMIWHGEQELREAARIAAHHGISFLLIIQDVRAMSTTAWDEEYQEIDSLQLMQRRTSRWRQSNASSSANQSRPCSQPMDPTATVFSPQRPFIGLMMEFVQDLQELWRTAAFAWEQEEASIQIEVWFTDHASRLHCTQSRSMRLYEDYSLWETNIASTWRDHLTPGSALEYHLVSPAPPDMPHETAAHVILVQNPHEALVTSLLTVYHGPQAQGRPVLQNAITTHEHIWIQELARGLGLENRCFRTPTSHHCEVWYGSYELQPTAPLAARSGHGLLLLFYPRDQADDPTVLLQLSTLLHPPHERQTHGQVAHTHGPCEEDNLGGTVAVRLKNYANQGSLPEVLELSFPGTADQATAELRNWGHELLVLDCWPQPFFACFTEVTFSVTAVSQHYLLCRDAWTPGEDDQVFLHSARHEISDIEILRHLCKLGFDRAVLLGRYNVRPGWTKIVFNHQDPEQQDQQKHKLPGVWPPPFQPVAGPSQPFFELPSAIPVHGDCQLLNGVTIHDMRQFFASGQDILCRNFTCFDLPEDLRHAFQPYDSEEPMPDLSDFDRILIFTDGTSAPAMRRLPPEQADELGQPDAWAFLVVGVSGDHDRPSFRPIGWTAQVVRYNPQGSHYNGVTKIGSDMAERTALTWAAIWRLSHNIDVETWFCTGSAVSGAQAFGQMGTGDADASFALFRGAFQALQAAMPLGKLHWHHVKSHTGLIYNEFVDLAAKRECLQSFYCPRQNLDMQFWQKVFPHLWMILAGPRWGLPTWKSGGFEIPPPALPSAEKEQPSQGQYKTRQRHVSFAFSMATANVQSLYKGPEGHAGKQHYLYRQMRSFNLNCIGIQEARTDPGVTCSFNILRLCSGHQDGHLGVELWFDLDMAIGHDSRNKPLYVRRCDFQVVHADPRRLLVKMDNPAWTAWWLVLHAPHSGYAIGERSKWWEDTSALLHQFGDDDNLFVLMDANAPPGQADGYTVIEESLPTTSGTPMLREFLLNHHLCLPATSDCHQGDRGTWTNPSGDQMHCIDHVAIPCPWLSTCTTSAVLEHFDLATAHEDHRAVALQLQWHHHFAEVKHISRSRPTGQVDFRNPHLSEQLYQHHPAEWSADIECHADGLRDTVYAALANCNTAPLDHCQIKKDYITEEIWHIRTDKLVHRRALKDLRRQLANELLFTVLRAWRQRDLPTIENYQYSTSLHCSRLKHFIGFRSKARQLKRALCNSKQQELRQTIDAMDARTTASEIIKQLRRFTGPTNPRKQRHQPLPMIRAPDGGICQYPAEALHVWIDFFMSMEGGQRRSHQALREQWVADLQKFSQAALTLDISELPTLTDLEAAFRRVACGKASGPDLIPGDLCHFQPAPLALACYSQLVKLVCHGQEPLDHKGGILAPIYKGKGSTSSCSSYRSILVSNSLGKVIHRAVRQHGAPLYEAFLQRQQVGGRRKIPVQLALHAVRAHARSARARQASFGVLFLDLTEAFYRILRELSLGGAPTDETVAHVMKRLQMPDHALHDLHALLQDPSALCQAGLSSTARNCIAAIHSNTHFWMKGQQDVAATCMGTRPGDCFADVIFGYTWSLVLRKLEAYMIQQDLVKPLPRRTTMPFFADASVPETPADPYVYIGPTWMDDLALSLEGASPAELEGHIGTATGHLLDLCKQHLMSPNLAKGKTEMLLVFRGRHSRAYREKHYGPSASSTFPVICEDGVQHIQIIKAYKHLGGWLHHRPDQRMEMAQKAAVAHTAFGRHRKILFANPHLDLQKRSELFNTLVLTKLLYGADTWTLDTKRDASRFHSVVIKLYKRLLGWRPDMDLTDESIMVRLGALSPIELLRRTRLRYLLVLATCGLDDIWSLLSNDQAWCRLLEEDLTWMWQQLCRSSDLKDPRHHFPQWRLLLTDHGRYWKRLVNRACAHAVLQRHRQQEVCELHQRIAVSTGFGLDLDSPDQSQVDGIFGCLACQKAFRSKAGEGAHMFRVHGLCSWSRKLFSEPSCPACLKFFHTMAKTKAHLYYSVACRTRLLNSNMNCPRSAGAGSMEDREREHFHDFLLPPLRGFGPHLPCPRQREHIPIEDGLHLKLVDMIADRIPLAEFREVLLTYIDSHPISWTMWRATLLFFIDTLAVEDALLFEYDIVPLTATLQELALAESWPFLQMSEAPRSGAHLRSIEECHEWCEQALLAAKLHPVPRQFGQHRYILHAFSGRRRLGDLQYYLEQIMQTKQTYVLHVISLDIIVDSVWGDISKDHVRQFWLAAIREQWVLAFIGGPPCETWSRVRAVGHHSVSVSGFLPRVLRDLHNLWGFASVSVRELTQLLTGNCLLGFSIEAMFAIALANGFGVLEHPAEPEDLPEAASIWRLPLMHLLMQQPGVTRCRFAQGMLGAPTPKPTDLLLVNMEDMILHLHRQRIRTELPLARAVGCDAKGHWRTAVLKEYPPALCLALAQAFVQHFDECPVEVAATQPPQHFQAICKKMECTVYSSNACIGRDFAG